ncbi:MAG: hypothetical protein QOH30_2619, partial [Baekduia sp.]|nr:hypothetical protein [Baekduia sp.]
MSRPICVLLLVLCAALTAAGCGRPQTAVRQLPTGPLDKGEYVHAFNVSAAGLAPKYGVGRELPRDAPAGEQARRVTALQRLLRAWAGR